MFTVQFTKLTLEIVIVQDVTKMHLHLSNCKACFSCICFQQHIMSEPEEITTMSGQKLPLKMSVDYISFSAHTDYQQTSEFIRALKPPHVVSLGMACVDKVA